MSVHYKFKSALEYDTVTFDGLHISVKDLKNAIIQQKRIGKSTDFDLQVTNAQTKEVYDDDNALIPKNTSLLIARIPTSVQTKNKQWEGYGGGDATPPNKLDEVGAIAKAVDLSSLDAPEDDKIKAMISQSTQDYDPSNYLKIRGANQMGAVPPNYRCYKCHQTGHWIKDCPLSKGPEPMEIKKSTGIPLSFMVPVEGPQVQGAMMTPNGSYAVPVLDHQTYTQKQQPPSSLPIQEQKLEIPEDLLCSICSDLLTDAVMIPCCGNSFCDECIRSILLESEDHECPDCHEKDISPGTLIPNRFLRTSVANFRNTTGYVKKPIYKQSNSRKIEEIVDNNSSKDVVIETIDDKTTNVQSVTTTKDENNEEKTVISEADSTEQTKHDDKIENKDGKVNETTTTATVSTEGPTVDAQKSETAVKASNSTGDTLAVTKSQEPKQNKSRENSPTITRRPQQQQPPQQQQQQQSRSNRSPPFTEPGRMEERPGTPTVDEPGINTNPNYSSEIRQYPPTGKIPSMINNLPSIQQTTQPPQINSGGYTAPQPITSYPPTNGPPPNFRLPPPGATAAAPPPYMPPGPYQVPPRPMYDPSRPPMTGPPPMYNPNYPPNSRSHHGRDYGMNDRRMRGRTPSGVIDDPLAAFNRMLREKDERERRAKRNLRRSYSRSRSRSRSYSRSPRRIRSRSPRRRLSRSRSRSFSISRSRSRSYSGSPPFRDFSPRPRRGPSSRYRSPVRSPPPRHRFKDNHQSDRYRDDDHYRDYMKDDRDYNRDRKYHRHGSSDYYRDERVDIHHQQHYQHHHHHQQQHHRHHDNTNRHRGGDNYYDNYDDRKKQTSWNQNMDKRNIGGTGSNNSGADNNNGASSSTATTAVATTTTGYYHHHHHQQQPEIHHQFPLNRYPARDYPSYKPDTIPPTQQLPPPPTAAAAATATITSAVRHFDDVAPPGVEEPPVPGLEPPSTTIRYDERYDRCYNTNPPTEQKRNDEIKSTAHDNKDKDKKEQQKKRNSRSRSPSMKRNKSKSRDSRGSSREHQHRKKRRDSSTDRKQTNNSEDDKSKKNKDKKKKRDKKDSDKKKRKDKKEKHKKEDKDKKHNKDDGVVEKKNKEIVEEAPLKDEEKKNEEQSQQQQQQQQQETTEAATTTTVETAQTTAQPEAEENANLYDDGLLDGVDTTVVECYGKVAEKTEDLGSTTPTAIATTTTTPPPPTNPSEIIEKEVEEDEKDILQIQTDIDLKTEIDNKNEMLANLPEKSKWEIDEDSPITTTSTTTTIATVNQEPTSPKDTIKLDLKATDKSTGKVTNEVLKRAENAIFAKAINAIRPIEIKKISLDRAKLYSSEIDDNHEKQSQEQLQQQQHQQEDETIPGTNPAPPLSLIEQPQQQQQQPRVSVKDRLGVKVDDNNERVIKIERNKSKSVSPFTRRGNEMARNYGIGERRVELVDRRRFDDRSRHQSRDNRNHNYHHHPYRRDYHRGGGGGGGGGSSHHHNQHHYDKRDDHRSDNRKHERNNKDRSKSRTKSSRQHDDDNKKSKKRSRSKSDSDRDKRRKKERKVNKKDKKHNKDDETENDNTDSKNKNDDNKAKEQVKPKVINDSKRKPTIDEANFEPDYDLESESEKDETVAKKDKVAVKIDEKKSSSSSESSDSSSDDERRKKRHKKHRKKKSKKDTSSSSSSSDSDSSDDERDKRKKKHRKKQKKKRKSKHK